MKTIHEILTLMYQEYVNDIDPNNPAETREYRGLCIVIRWLHDQNKITEKEHDIAMEYIYKNKPKKLCGTLFWTPWIRRPRLLWLKKHMGITK